ncbi:MAG TPA: hypothetical protein VFO70_01790, partial [Chitinophagaceae bacterium]|nr:hypothetical protein [Chitinophagaceae bacterium]
TLDSAALRFGTSGGVGITSKKIGSGTNGLNFWTGGAINLSISQTGNVGIGGVYDPSYRLRVYNGNSHFEGNLSAEGSISTLTRAAIGGAIDNNYRLRVYDGNSRFGGDLHATGNAAIGGEVDNNYRLRVIGGNSRFGGDLHATGNAAIGGEVDNNYRLRVIGGNSRFGGDLHATGNAAIGGDVDNNYRLRVYDGNSRFGGDVQVTGNINTSSLAVGDMLTIKGTGSVRSEGVSPLRIGFEQKYVAFEHYDPHEQRFHIISLSDFSNTSDVRVIFSHYLPEDNLAWDYSHRFRYRITDMNPVANNCILWIYNDSNAESILKGTLGLISIIKDN